jgi:hypothetical protein
VVTLYGTGATWHPGLDGVVATEAVQLDPEQNEFYVIDSIGDSLDILYAGTSPGLLYSVFRLSVQLPYNGLNAATLALTLEQLSVSGTLSSNTVEVYLVPGFTPSILTLDARHYHEAAPTQ